MGKSTISMAIVNSYVTNYQRVVKYSKSRVLFMFLPSIHGKKRAGFPQIPWLFWSFLSSHQHFRHSGRSTIWDIHHGLLWFTYGLHMVYIWFIHFGISVLGKAEMFVAKITAHGFRAPKYSGERNGFDSNANGATVHLILNPHL